MDHDLIQQVLTPLEIASCVVVGSVPAPPGRPQDGRTVDPVLALEGALLGALQRPPCLVSFSGGHDSSLVLAAAVRAARREQLQMPVPVTWRPTGAPLADESKWQEGVVAALGIDDWLRLPTGDDLDFVGPVATEVLRRHGVLYPANAYFHAPLLARAATGTLVTGFGGDQVLGRLGRPRRPSWVPRRSGRWPSFGWLRAAAARRLLRGLRRESRDRPARYKDRPAWAATRRDLAMTRSSLALLGRDHDTSVVHPLLDPGFLFAVSRSGSSPDRSGGRAGLLADLFAGTYPDEVIRCRPKATFAEVFWRRHTRSVVRSWDGRGIDDLVVDAGGLRLEWFAPEPDLCTAMLVQQVWLETCGQEGRR